MQKVFLFVMMVLALNYLSQGTPRATVNVSVVHTPPSINTSYVSTTIYLHPGIWNPSTGRYSSATPIPDAAFTISGGDPGTTATLDSHGGWQGLSDLIDVSFVTGAAGYLTNTTVSAVNGQSTFTGAIIQCASGAPTHDPVTLTLHVTVSVN